MCELMCRCWTWGTRRHLPHLSQQSHSSAGGYNRYATCSVPFGSRQSLTALAPNGTGRTTLWRPFFMEMDRSFRARPLSPGTKKVTLRMLPWGMTSIAMQATGMSTPTDCIPCGTFTVCRGRVEGSSAQPLPARDRRGAGERVSPPTSPATCHPGSPHRTFPLVRLLSFDPLSGRAPSTSSSGRLRLRRGACLPSPHPAARSPRRLAVLPVWVRLSRRAQPASYCPGPTSSRSSSSPAPRASTPSPNSERHGQSAGSGKPSAAASSSASLTVSASPPSPPWAAPRRGAAPPVTSGSGPPRARPSPSSVRSWSSSCRASCEKCVPRRTPRGQPLSALHSARPRVQDSREGQSRGTASPAPTLGPRPKVTPGTRPRGGSCPPARGAAPRSLVVM